MVKRTWKRWTEKEIELLIYYYKSGWTVKQIQDIFAKTRSAGSVAVKINQLQKEGKIMYRQKSKQPKSMQKKTKVIVSDKKIPEEIPMKVIAKLSQEIKILKGQLKSAKKALKECMSNPQKYKHDVWNEPYKSKWSKTPPWVEAGKKAMEGIPHGNQPMSPQPTMHGKIADKCNEIRILLQEKNAQYGDSAMNPVRVFSTADSTEQLKVRIDDKLSRLVRGDDSLESDEEVIKDLIGYLILLLIQYDTQAQSEGNA